MSRQVLHTAHKVVRATLLPTVHSVLLLTGTFPAPRPGAVPQPVPECHLPYVPPLLLLFLEDLVFYIHYFLTSVLSFQSLTRSCLFLVDHFALSSICFSASPRPWLSHYAGSWLASELTGLLGWYLLDCVACAVEECAPQHQMAGPQMPGQPVAFVPPRHPCLPRDFFWLLLEITRYITNCQSTQC